MSKSVTPVVLFSFTVFSMIGLICVYMNAPSAQGRPTDGGELDAQRAAAPSKEDVVRALLAKLPRIGKNKELFIYEGDLVMNEAELRSYITRMDAARTAPRQAFKFHEASQCITCYNKKICNRQIHAEKKWDKDTATKLCSEGIKKQIEPKTVALQTVKEQFKKIQMILATKSIDTMYEIHKVPDEWRVNGNKRAERLRSGIDLSGPDLAEAYATPTFRPCSKKNPCSSLVEDSDYRIEPDPRFFSLVQIKSKSYKQEIIMGIVDVVPETCKISSWLDSANINSVTSTSVELTYAIDRQSFVSRSSEAEYVAFSKKLQQAANNWNEVCAGCLVKFVYKPELDKKAGIQPGDGVMFVARADDRPEGDQEALAASFFPLDEKDRRYLYLYPKFFVTNSDQTALLKHELGHILGLRHEHIRSQSGCIMRDQADNIIKENPYYLPFTNYDRLSIMHYDCDDGYGQRTAISNDDGNLVRLLYEKMELTLNQDAIRKQLEQEEDKQEILKECKRLINESDLQEILISHVRAASLPN